MLGSVMAGGVTFEVLPADAECEVADVHAWSFEVGCFDVYLLLWLFLHLRIGYTCQTTHEI